MQPMRKFVILAATAALLAGGSARAADSYWTNSTGNYTNNVHWDAGVPGTTDRAIFTNAANYQVDFTSSVTNYPVFVHDGTVTFNLNGNTWVASNATKTVNAIIGANANVTVSSASGGGTLVFSGGNNRLLPGLAGTLQINDSLGWPVTVVMNNPGREDGTTYTNGIAPGAQLVVSGTGTVLRLASPADNKWGGQVLLTNRALFEITGSSYAAAVGNYSAGATGRVVVADGMFHTTAGLVIAQQQTAGLVSLSSNSTWTNDTGTVQVGADSFLVSRTGVLQLDQSSLVTPNMRIGGPTLARSTGFAEILNGSTITVTDSIRIEHASDVIATKTNTLVLGDSTILLGSGATAGVLTNRGIMRASGTITGLGSSPATVRNEKWLHIGASIGTLALSNASLELAAVSSNYFEFDPSTAGVGDAINLTDGSATISGALFFTNTTGATTLAFGQWNFLTADVITNNAWFDNLTTIVDGLTNTLPALLYAGYTYGVVDLPDGGQALQLSINMIPEPSTILLLVGGGLVLWRFRR